MKDATKKFNFLQLTLDGSPIETVSPAINQPLATIAYDDTASAFYQVVEDPVRTRVWVPLGGTGAASLPRLIYADAVNGDDANPGTAAFPVRTLGRAVQLLGQLGAGPNRIFLADGTYVIDKPTALAVGAQPSGTTPEPLAIMGGLALQKTLVAGVGSSQTAIVDAGAGLTTGAAEGMVLRALTGANAVPGAPPQRAVVQNDATTVVPGFAWDAVPGVGDTFGLYAPTVTIEVQQPLTWVVESRLGVAILGCDVVCTGDLGTRWTVGGSFVTLAGGRIFGNNALDFRARAGGTVALGLGTSAETLADARFANASWSRTGGLLRDGFGLISIYTLEGGAFGVFGSVVHGAVLLDTGTRGLIESSQFANAPILSTGGLGASGGTTLEIRGGFTGPTPTTSTTIRLDDPLPGQAGAAATIDAVAAQPDGSTLVTVGGLAGLGPLDIGNTLFLTRIGDPGGVGVQANGGAFVIESVPDATHAIVRGNPSATFPDPNSGAIDWTEYPFQVASVATDSTGEPANLLAAMGMQVGATLLAVDACIGDGVTVEGGAVVNGTGWSGRPTRFGIAAHRAATLTLSNSPFAALGPVALNGQEADVALSPEPGATTATYAALLAAVFTVNTPQAVALTSTP